MLGMTIARNLPRLRKEKGLSQDALAKKAGVSQQLISRLESGVDLTSKKLPDLARALEVPVYEIDESYLAEAGPIRSGEAILAMLNRIEGLDERGVELAFMTITTAMSATAARREPPSADDQSEPATPRRVSRPSPQR